MLRTRTNDTIEYLDGNKYLVKNNFGLWNFKGMKVEDVAKYNFIYFNEGLVDGDNELIPSNALLYKMREYPNLIYVATEGDTSYMVNLAFNNNFNISSTFYNTTEQFENLVETTPTDVRLVEDQGKLQLQLEHDSEVLSNDKGVNDLLGSKFGYNVFNNNDYTGYIILYPPESSDAYFEICGDFKIHKEDLSGIEEYNLSQLFTNVFYECVKPLTVYAYDGNKTVVGLIAYNREQDGYVSTLTHLDFQAIDDIKPITYNFINKVTGDAEEL